MDTAQDKFTRFGQHAVPAVLFFTLIGLAFVGRPNWSVPPPPRVWTKLEVPNDRSFVAAIESPLNAQRGGYLAVYGWTAATAPGVRVTKIEINIDGTLAGATEDFIARPDITANFGRPGLETSGWRYVIAIGNRTAGEHQLQLAAISSDGKREIALTRSFTIVE
jgi:hypothetical protein